MEEHDIQSEASGVISLVSNVAGFIIRVFLAVTTAGFFSTFATDLWTWVLPASIASPMAAFTGVVLIDGLAVVWSYLNRTGATTEEQEKYSNLATWFDMGLSIIITAVYVILTTPLLAASVSQETFTAVIQLASWSGILIGVLAFVGNGLLWHLYATNSIQSIQQKNDNQIRIMVTKGLHIIKKEAKELELTKMLADIREELDSLTTRSATQHSQGWLTRRFAFLRDEEGAGIATSALPAESRPEEARLEERRRPSQNQNTRSSEINGSDRPLW